MATTAILPSSGILLKDSLVPETRSRHDSAVASSSTTSFSSHSRSPSAERSPRRIRFAPLPEPRRPPESVFFPDDSDSDTPPPLPPSPSPPTLTLDIPHSPKLLPLPDQPKSKSISWGQKLLRPLLTSRKSYPDSNDASPDTPQFQYKGGAPLDRRVSTGSSVFKWAKETERSTTYHDGAPLHPVHSESTFATKSLPRNGQRMLNGRVYGRRTSASQTAQDTYEPEFVEWGYGGMGSVDNNRATCSSSVNGLDWAKVQSRGKVVGATQDDDQDADDGSGMGWVKRRREQRERERREREERENASNGDKSVPEIAVHPPDANDPSKKSLDKGFEEHLCQAVSVPAPYHHHHHRPKDPNATPPALSRDNSTCTIPACSTLSPHQSISSDSSATSSTSSIDEEDDDDDSDTERDSDEEDDEDEGRITSKGAGVEKISRHKE